MKEKTKKIGLLAVILGIGLILFSGCGSQPDTTTTTSGNGETTTTTMKPAYDGKTMVIAHPPWPGGSMKNLALKEVFEKRFPGLEVELKQVSMALTLPGIEQETIDLFIEDWLPFYTPVKTYKARNAIVNLGPNHNTATSAMTVPDYTAEELDLETIQDLKGKEDTFGGKIYCIEPGSENCNQIQEDVETFDLDLEVIASSTAGMTTQLKQSYNNQEHVVIAGWQPFWIHYSFNLTELKDPTGKSIYTYRGHIDTIVGNGFEEKFGERMYNVVDKINFHNETSEIMYYKQQGVSKKEAAHKWVTENQDKIDAWFEEGEDEHEWCKHIGNEDMQGCPDNIGVEVHGINASKFEE